MKNFSLLAVTLFLSSNLSYASNSEEDYLMALPKGLMESSIEITNTQKPSLPDHERVIVEKCFRLISNVLYEKAITRPCLDGQDEQILEFLNSRGWLGILQEKHQKKYAELKSEVLMGHPNDVLEDEASFQKIKKNVQGSTLEKVEPLIIEHQSKFQENEEAVKRLTENDMTLVEHFEAKFKKAEEEAIKISFERNALLEKHQTQPLALDQDNSGLNVKNNPLEAQVEDLLKALAKVKKERNSAKKSVTALRKQNAAQENLLREKTLECENLMMIVENAESKLLNKDKEITIRDQQKEIMQKPNIQTVKKPLGQPGRGRGREKK